MVYMRHHAIVVTTWDEKLAAEAHAKATELGMSVTGVIGPVINGNRSFLVGPDGSKEGWEESHAGNSRRDAFIGWLRERGGSDWVEVQYGDDKGEACVRRHSDDTPEGL